MTSSLTIYIQPMKGDSETLHHDPSFRESPCQLLLLQYIMALRTIPYRVNMLLIERACIQIVTPTPRDLWRLEAANQWTPVAWRTYT